VKLESETKREVDSLSAPEPRISETPAFALFSEPARPRRFWRAAEAGLWAIAAASAIYLVYVFGDRALWSRDAERRLAESIESIESVEGVASAAAHSSAVATASVPAKPAAKPPFIARLEIPSLELTALVVDGVDDVTLRRAVGRIPSSSRPGEPGDVALAGHRDTDFRSLQRLKRGDRVELATSEGKFAYEVEWIRIVAPERVDVLKPDGSPTLTLVTCYPFRYIGRAPMRYVVRAREVSRPPLLVARS